MARDVAERDALRGMAESLGGEKAALQRRLWQLRAELESETAAAQAAEQGARPTSACPPPALWPGLAGRRHPG
jgi:hypothetical protein